MSLTAAVQSGAVQIFQHHSRPFSFGFEPGVHLSSCYRAMLLQGPGSGSAAGLVWSFGIDWRFVPIRIRFKSSDRTAGRLGCRVSEPIHSAGSRHAILSNQFQLSGMRLLRPGSLGMHGSPEMLLPLSPTGVCGRIVFLKSS